MNFGAGRNNIMSKDCSYEKSRRHTRYSIEGMDVHAHMLFSDEVQLDNLSVNGACVHAMTDLHVGCKYLIRISDKQSSLYVGGALVWKNKLISPEGTSLGCKAGLRFLSNSPDDLVRLKDFMRTSGEPDERRVGDQFISAPLRFYIKSNVKAVLKYPEILNIKKISLGGMLMESPRALAREDNYPFKIRLSDGSEPIKCKGRIASIVRHSENMRQNFDIGVEFVNLDDSGRTRLDGFIRSLS